MSELARKVLEHPRWRATTPGVMFEVGERVFSDEACRRLVIQRAAWERAQGHDWAPGQGFFPAYRA